MRRRSAHDREPLTRRLREAEATIAALLAGQIDAVVDARSQSPVLLWNAQSALRASEEALRKSEAQYRQIVEATTDGILKTDGASRIVFANRRVSEMLGYDPDDMIGTSLYAHMDENAKVLAIEASEARTVSSEPFDATFRHRDGTGISVNIVETRLVDGDGAHVGSLAVIRDVTEKAKLHAQLMVSDRMASVGTLAAGVAHEINNPLAAVIANLDCVSHALAQVADSGGVERSATSLRDEINEPIDDARHAAERVRLIVRDLSIFSRSPSEDSSHSVDVHAIMESSLRMAWNEIRHRARLVKNYGSVPLVAANEARLGQVFLNLLVNAAQALPDGQAELHEITVATRLDGAKVVIEVSDTGPGIPPHVIGRIFDAFFTTKPVGAGTGLGLAISHRIVTDMGGELTVVSEPGKGTTFRLRASVAAPEVVHASIPEPPSQRATRRGQVLVVDDEVLVLRLVRRVLCNEHDLTLTASSAEALRLCADGMRFDLILCDLMMPDMTGMELYQHLSRVASDQAERMLFMTGGAFTVEARKFLNALPREHVEKPFDLRKLRALVSSYIH